MILSAKSFLHYYLALILPFYVMLCILRNNSEWLVLYKVFIRLILTVQSCANSNEYQFSFAFFNLVSFNANDILLYSQYSLKSNN